ncbi:MAG: xanthine dehydrogenase accessory protein XdhC [Halieaceae bacterium]|nr:xanthine dehydrogenase accessory protein XdhC [Halieaceae bacterium]
MKHWSEIIADCERRGRPYVIVTVLGARGSTPRDSGTKMIVEHECFHGTIGGGELEHRALRRARELLAGANNGQWLENYPLGEKLGQCCGGSTSLLFEGFVPSAPAVYLFGAGHVGRALAPLLATLPLRLLWIDERDGMLPAEGEFSADSGVVMIRDRDPVDLLRSAPSGAYFIVMTHQHPLDYALAEAALQRGDAAYVGVIGSASKARRFRMRLAHRGFGDERIASMHCPIGLGEVPGKLPSEIAVSVAGQVIAVYQSHRVAAPAFAGPTWKELRESLGGVGARASGIALPPPQSNEASPAAQPDASSQGKNPHE